VRRCVLCRLGRFLPRRGAQEVSHGPRGGAQRSLCPKAATGASEERRVGCTASSRLDLVGRPRARAGSAFERVASYAVASTANKPQVDPKSHTRREAEEAVEAPAPVASSVAATDARVRFRVSVRVAVVRATGCKAIVFHVAAGGASNAGTLALLLPRGKESDTASGRGRCAVSSIEVNNTARQPRAVLEQQWRRETKAITSNATLTDSMVSIGAIVVLLVNCAVVTAVCNKLLKDSDLQTAAAVTGTFASTNII